MHDGSAPREQSSLVDPGLEYTDPTPDIQSLFGSFNERFFWGRLDDVEVKWNKRMIKDVGRCIYRGRGRCTVLLSERILKLRPRKDLVETLLHEMIHAYLFVTDNNRDRSDHGPHFLSHMTRINEEAGTNITENHYFQEEVEFYHEYWWKCDGPCQNRPPYFGMVKHARNRAPGPRDWWKEHRATCRGTFIKIKEPEAFKRKKSAATAQGASNVQDIEGSAGPSTRLGA